MKSLGGLLDEANIEIEEDEEYAPRCNVARTLHAEKERDALRAALEKALRFIDSLAAETYAVDQSHIEIVERAQKAFDRIVFPKVGQADVLGILNALRESKEGG